MNRLLRTINVCTCLLLLLSACTTPARFPNSSPASTPSPEAAPTASPTSPASPSAPILPPEPTGSTSAEQITQALADGKLDEVTALKYQVFSQFSDPRLPAEYAGAANLSTDSHIVDQLAAKFFTLSAEDQAAMLPFLVPPVYKGSWGDPAFVPAAPSPGPTSAPKYKSDAFDEFKNDLPCDYIDQENWDSITALHAPVRFWWLKSRPGDGAMVQRFLTAMDDDVWPKLTKLMGRTPKMDGGYACNGGSADFDVYVTPEVARSYAASLIPPGCKETPSYIVLNPAVSDAILAHEFMHAIQWSYNTAVDCMYPGNYAWLVEATAEWSQDFVYPNSNEEQRVLKWFFNPAGPSGRGANLELRNDQHEYAAYLFFFYLTRQNDQPEIVRDVWDGTTSMDSLAAVSKALPEGLDAAWHDFAVRNMDEPPFDNYQRWDNLNLKPSGASMRKIKVGTGFYPLQHPLDHLSVSYDWFTFSSNSRLVAFYNGWTYNLDSEPINATMGITEVADGTKIFKFTQRVDEPVKSARVQALYRLEGEVEWMLEDWTDQPYVVFCRDARAEKLADLVIITSNSAVEGKVSQTGEFDSQLSVQDVGCWRYGGSASVVMTGEGDDGSMVDQQQVPSAAFERSQNHENYAYPFLNFKLAEGEWQRTYQLTALDGSCTGSGSASGPLPPAVGDEYADEIVVLYGALEGPSRMRYTAEASPKQPVNVTFQCPENTLRQPEQEWPWIYLDMLSMTLDKIYTVGSGGTLAGTDDFLWDVDGASMIYTWQFEPLAEP